MQLKIIVIIFAQVIVLSTLRGPPQHAFCYGFLGDLGAVAFVWLQVFGLRVQERSFRIF